MSGTLKYEWVRISTVRSTWILVVLGAVLPAFLALFVSWLIGSLGSEMGGPPEGAGNASAVGSFLTISAAVLCTIGAAAFGQEYRHGLIRITLSTFPRRTPIFVAKAVLVALFIAIAGAVSIAAITVGDALGGAVAGTGLVWDDTIIGTPGLRAVLYLVLFVLMAFAITALTRNQPLGIILPIVLAAVVEPIISTVAFVQEWTWMDWVLPFTGGAASVDLQGAEGWGHLGVFFLWFLALTVPAWVLFVRRDA